jgi:hypothetical protein
MILVNKFDRGDKKGGHAQIPFVATVNKPEVVGNYTHVLFNFPCDCTLCRKHGK